MVAAKVAGMQKSTDGQEMESLNQVAVEIEEGVLGSGRGSLCAIEQQEWPNRAAEYNSRPPSSFLPRFCQGSVATRNYTDPITVATRDSPLHCRAIRGGLTGPGYQIVLRHARNAVGCPTEGLPCAIRPPSTCYNAISTEYFGTSRYIAC